MGKKALIVSFGFFLFLYIPLVNGLCEDFPESGGPKYPIMQPDLETLQRWIKEHEMAPRAPIDAEIQAKLESGELAQGPKPILLDHITYTPAERNQGSCENCWVWAGTAQMEIAHSVHYGVKDRLSIQLYNSEFEDGNNVTGDYACCGSNLTRFANDYNTGSRRLIPWSNVNAHFQDGGRQCADSRSLVPLANIWTAPEYTYASNISVQSIQTTEVNQSTAINNIKNILHQNKGVDYSFCLANNTDWNVFFNFWDNQNETVLWDPTPFFGHIWIPPGLPNAGGCHEVVIVGYNDDDPNADNHYWIVLNSWGTGATNNRPNGLFRLKMNIDYKGTLLVSPSGPTTFALWFETLGWVPWVSTNSLQMAVKGSTNNNIYVRSKRGDLDWDPWYMIDGLTTHAPTATQFNSRFYMAVKGMDNKVYVRNWYVIWWPWETFPGATDVSPALVVYRNRLYVFVKGTNNRIYYKSMGTDGIWDSLWSMVPSGMTDDTPAVVVYNDQIVLFVKGLNNKIYLKRMGPDGTWDQWLSFASGATPSAPSATVYKNNIYLFVRGMDNNIYYNWTNGDSLSWMGWLQPLPGTISTSPSVTIGSSANDLYVSVKGDINNNMYLRHYSWNEQKWLPETDWEVVEPGHTTDTPVLSPYWW